MTGNFSERVAAFVIFSLLISLAAACDIKGFGVRMGEEGKRKGGPPPHAPAYGYRAKYTYRYYPSTHVYFDVSRRLYFYLEGTVWKMSVSLPEHLRVNLGDHVTIEMDTDKPYTRFAEHKKKYPPGQLRKKTKGRKKW